MSGRGASPWFDRGRSDSDGGQGGRYSSPARSNSRSHRGDYNGLAPPVDRSTSRGRGGSQERRGWRGGSSHSRSGSGGRNGPPEVFRTPQGFVPQPDAAVTKAENVYIKNSSGIDAVELLSLTTNHLRRPGYGTQGTPAVVFANFFDIQPVANLSFYRYSLSVQPVGRASKPAKLKIKRIITLLLDEPDLEGALTDYGSILFSRRKIKNIPRDVVIPFRAEGKDGLSHSPMSSYRVTIQEAGDVQISALLEYLKSTKVATPEFATSATVIQALNVLIGHHPHLRSDLISIGPHGHFSIDSQSSNFDSLVPGIGLLRGYCKSVRTATSRLLLNVNMSHAICWEEMSVADFLKKDGFNEKLVKAFSIRLKSVRLDRLHLVKKDKEGKRIPNVVIFGGFASANDGFSEEHPPQVAYYGAGPKNVKFYFTGDSGKSAPVPADVWGNRQPASRYISVWEYFQTYYPTIKMEENLPVINFGSSQYPKYLPAEACQILPGQPSKKKLNSWATQTMINLSCRTPKSNADSIMSNGRDVLGLAPPRNDGLARIGLTIGSCLVTVPARVLPPPQIKYLNSKYVNVANGEWFMGNNKYATGTKIRKWTYIWLRGDQGSGFSNERALHEKVKTFANFMRNLGVEFDPPMKGKNGYPHVDQENDDGNWHDKVTAMIEAMAGSGDWRPEFLLIILPSTDSVLYNKIKTCADTKAGIHTVCVVGNKFVKTEREEQYFANVSLKFNLKAGGINHTIDPPKLGIISEGKTMVMGIDVTHPSPSSKDTAPSVAGVVASVDKFLGQWPADLRIQESRKEMVSDLDAMFKSRLVLWQKKNNALPENILVYRDGVSEGQYQTVLDEELPLLRSACKDLYPVKQPPAISIIIVGKRHHYRFYPSRSDEADRSHNCLAGTIVDRGVTHAKDWDFFLQAHACIKGTARSAHYVVILDEIFRNRKPKGSTQQNAADALESLTHNMCHLFGRATRAVSVCPPFFYADLVCGRARCYLSSVFDPQKQQQNCIYDPRTGEPMPPIGEPGPRAEGVVVHERLRDTMFYI